MSCSPVVFASLLLLVPLSAGAQSLALSQDPLVTDSGVTFRVSGAAPGDEVTVLRSTSGAGAGPCPSALAGSCLDILEPVKALGTGIADASGNAEISITLPRCAPERALTTQAVSRGSAVATSNTVTDTIARAPNSWLPLTDVPGTSPYEPVHDSAYSPLTADQRDLLFDWYLDGSAAGNETDTFHSFDGSHSTIYAFEFGHLLFYPSSTYYSAIFNLVDSVILPNAINFGVQSYGWIDDGKTSLAAMPNGYYSIGYWPTVYRKGYVNNFLLAHPVVDSGVGSGDTVTYLSPYYFLTERFSDSDSQLLHHIIAGAAALHPELKARMKEEGKYVHSLMYLFKSTVADDYHSAEAHMSAYEPYEGGEAWAREWDLIEAAHNLTHVPPTAQLHVADASYAYYYPYYDGRYVQLDSGLDLYEAPEAIFGEMWEGDPVLEFTVDASGSYADTGGCVQSWSWDVLRGGDGVVITPLNAEASRVRVEIPWQAVDNRTDILALVSDGELESAPAYITIDQRKASY